MDDDERYQGSRNRETWTLLLWINNDEGLYRHFREHVRCEDADDAQEHIKSLATGLLNPDEYRDEHGNRQPEHLARASFEIGSLWRVDWSEVVADLMED